MKKRPRSVVLVSCLFIAAGFIGFAYHASELKAQDPVQSDLILVLFIRLLAVVGGVFALRGANWARWLLLAWMTYHVIISVSRPVPDLVVHGLILAGVSYVLLRPDASAYFRGTS
jgi:hypothetical protein